MIDARAMRFETLRYGWDEANPLSGSRVRQGVRGAGSLAVEVSRLRSRMSLTPGLERATGLEFSRLLTGHNSTNEKHKKPFAVCDYEIGYSERSSEQLRLVRHDALAVGDCWGVGHCRPRMVVLAGYPPDNGRSDRADAARTCANSPVRRGVAPRLDGRSGAWSRYRRAGARSFDSRASPSFRSRRAGPRRLDSYAGASSAPAAQAPAASTAQAPSPAPVPQAPAASTAGQSPNPAPQASAASTAEQTPTAAPRPGDVCRLDVSSKRRPPAPRRQRLALRRPRRVTRATPPTTRLRTSWRLSSPGSSQRTWSRRSTTRR